MKKYKVVITNFLYYAPSIYVDAVNSIEAEKIARSSSGLSRFDSWVFIPVTL